MYPSGGLYSGPFSAYQEREFKLLRKCMIIYEVYYALQFYSKNIT